MSLEEFRILMASSSFLRELHHLLWIDPLLNKGTLDEGWSCRDHALTIGALAMIQGFSVTVMNGSAAFIQGPQGDRRPVGRSTGRHWWLRIEGIGTCDLSPRLVKTSELMEWDDWKGAVLVGGTFVPSGWIDYMMTSSAAKFDEVCAFATNIEGKRFSLYLVKAVEQLTARQLDKATEWIHSPLSDRLKRSFPMRKDIYARAVLHLDDFANGKAGSLADLPQMQAWTSVAARVGNARMELGARIDSR